MAFSNHVPNGDVASTKPPPHAPNGVSVIDKPPAMDPLTLPSSASSDLVLLPANPVEYTQCSRLNADEWRGPLTIDQYLEREDHLLRQQLTKDGRSTGWILTSTKLPLDEDGNHPILASCETILANAYVAKDGKLDKVQAHGIGSVFARAEHRGKGYAGRMMMELGRRLESWQQNNGNRGVFSVLYSDIGQKFYSRFGWKVFPSRHINLAPMHAQVYRSTAKTFPEVEDIYSADLNDIPAAEIVEQELVASSKAKPGTYFVSIKPDLDHFAWHHAREEFLCSTLGLQPPKVKGAIHRPTGVAIIWNRVLPEKQDEWQLHVLHTVIPAAVKHSAEGFQAVSALLLRAQLEASSFGLEAGVEVWDPSDPMIAAAQNLRTEAHDKVQVVNRDTEHICSLRWIGSSTPDADDVVWEYNQKYAWC